MNNRYSDVIIIFNPNSSSGRAQPRAQRLARQLKRRKFKHVILTESEYSGHSETIAYQAAKELEHPLIVSVSGDGGYNEVINGVLKATAEGKEAKPVCAILAAGNANDHRRAIAKRPLLRAIIDATPEAMDVLKLHFGNTDRYAHSYIGIGTTAEIVSELNQEQLTRWKEIKIVTRNLLNFHRFSISDTEHEQRQLDSLVFANIHRMSKVLKLNDHTNLHDGLFNMFAIPHRTRFKFVFLALRLAIFGAKNPPQLASYTFRLDKPQLGQLDGEVMALPARTDITVSVKNESLLTIR